MRFNLEEEIVKAKFLFIRLDKYIKYYTEFTGKKLSEITLYKKDYDKLNSKILAALRKAGLEDTISVELYYRGRRLKSD